MAQPSIKDRFSARLAELAIQNSGRSPVQRTAHRFIDFFIRLNRFYDQLYEKSKPRWMRNKKS